MCKKCLNPIYFVQILLAIYHSDYPASQSDYFVQIFYCIYGLFKYIVYIVRLLKMILMLLHDEALEVREIMSRTVQSLTLSCVVSMSCCGISYFKLG